MAISALSITTSDIVANELVYASNELARWEALVSWASDEVIAKTVDLSSNQSIGGNKTFTGTTTLKDGSVMASSAAPTTDAMISNKAYVDSRSGVNMYQVTDKTNTAVIPNTTSWHDVDDMYITETFSGGPIFIAFTGTYRSGSGVEARFAINVDGTNVFETTQYDTHTNEPTLVSFHWGIPAGLSGLKTIKIRYRANNATYVSFKSATDDSARNLTVTEFKS